MRWRMAIKRPKFEWNKTATRKHPEDEGNFGWKLGINGTIPIAERY